MHSTKISEELYLVGKLYDTKAFHNPAMIKEALLTTLGKLNVAYIDMYFIHCPEGTVFSSEVFADTWNEMELLVVNDVKIFHELFFSIDMFVCDV